MASKSLTATVSIAGKVSPSLNNSIATATSIVGKLSKAGVFAGKTIAVVGKAAASAVAASAVSGTAAVVKLTKDAMSAYAEFEQVAGGAKLMFGDAYDYIAEKAQNAYKTVQMSENEYFKQVNSFATGLKSSLGGDARAAAELADRIVTAEADVIAATGRDAEAVQAAFNGIMRSNYTMLDNLGLGIGPTKKGMQELIKTVNDWNKANGKATKYQMDNLADMEAALVDYIEMQGMAGYAAKEGLDTIQGSLKSTKAAWQNLLTALGKGDADIGQYVDGLINSAMALADNVAPVAERVLEGIATFIEKGLPKFAARLPSIVEKLLPTLLGAVAKTTVAILKALPEFIRAALPIIKDGLATLLSELLGVPKSEISAFFQSFIDAFFQIVDAVKPVFQTLLDVFREIWPAIEKITQKSLPIIVEAIGIICDALNEILPILEPIMELTEAVTTPLLDLLMPILKLLGALLKPILQLTIALLEPLLKLATAIAEGIGKALEFVGPLIEWLADLLGGLISFLTEGFSVKWEDAWRGISEIFSSVWNGLSDLVKAPINMMIDIINWFLEQVNTISFDLPDWDILGKYAGAKIGFNIDMIPHLAKGGFTDGLSIAGEAGTEAVISFNRMYRTENIETWAEAGRMLMGDNSLTAVAGRVLGLEDFSLESLAGDTYIVFDIGGITWAPTIEGDVADKEDLMEVLRRHEEELMAWLEEYMEAKGAAAYA